MHSSTLAQNYRKESIKTTHEQRQNHLTERTTEMGVTPVLNMGAASDNPFGLELFDTAFWNWSDLYLMFVGVVSAHLC